MARSDLYSDDGELEAETCPECGDAILADHGDRKHCGKCGFTEWQ